MQYIIWDPKDGEVRRDDDGEFLSDGIIGRVGPNNVYLRAYAEYLDDTSLDVLEVGERVNARFRLSGESAVYQVIRVR